MAINIPQENPSINKSSPIVTATAQELLESLGFVHSTHTVSGFEFYRNPASQISIGAEEIDNISRYLSNPSKVEFGSGMQSKIYKIQIGDKHYVIAKKRLDNDLKNEIKAQQHMYNIIEEAGLGDTIIIPEIHGCYNNTDDNAIVMEYLPGKTLFHLKAEKILSFVAELLALDESIKRDISTCASDKDMRSLIQTIATMIPHNTIQAIQGFKNKVLTLGDQEGQDAYPFMMTNIIHNAYINISNLTTAHGTKMQLFTLEEGRIVKELFTKVLDLMKQHNFVHGDLNPNNIMCIKSEGPDTKRAIIDFGLSEQHHGNYERDSKFFQDSFHSAGLPKY